MKSGLYRSNMAPEEKLQTAREGLKEDNSNVEAMLVVVERALAEEDEKKAVLKKFLENAQGFKKLIKKKGEI